MYQLDHTMGQLIMRVNLITRVPPYGPSPLNLSLIIRKCVCGENKTGEFMHGIEKHLLNTFFIISSLDVLAWNLPFLKWCRRELDSF